MNDLDPLPVTREQLRQTLVAWQVGELTPAEVHDWAQTRYSVVDVEPENDDIAREILGHLDILDINLTTADDVPVFLKMLDLPLDRSGEAMELLRQHAESTDISARIVRYRDDPFYGRFCT